MQVCFFIVNNEKWMLSKICWILIPNIWLLYVFPNKDLQSPWHTLRAVSIGPENSWNVSHVFIGRCWQAKVTESLCSQSWSTIAKRTHLQIPLIFFRKYWNLAVTLWVSPKNLQILYKLMIILYYINLYILLTYYIKILLYTMDALKG